MPPPPVATAATPEPLLVIPQEEYSKLATEQEQKQFIGNYLYQFVSRKENEEVAGKVTGMILDGQTIQYILYLCGDKKAFYTLVEEAVKLINQAN
jgi:hypothetical protein